MSEHSAAKPVKRLNARDWLDIGLNGLTRHGAAGLTLEALCASAGKTRGSFYHHFGDHDAFVAALLARWQEIQTEGLIRDVEAIAVSGNGESAGARSARLHHLASALDHDLDVAVRRFAAEHKVARAAVEAVDARRVEFIEKLYSEGSGLARQQAQALARIEYALFVGWQMLWPKDAPPDVQSLRALLDGLQG